MITDYRIIESDSKHKLEEEVRNELKYGWEPLGGVCYANNTSVASGKWCQAIVMLDQKARVQK